MMWSAQQTFRSTVLLAFREEADRPQAAATDEKVGRPLALAIFVGIGTRIEQYQ